MILCTQRQQYIQLRCSSSPSCRDCTLVRPTRHSASYFTQTCADSPGRKRKIHYGDTQIGDLLHQDVK
jgi:hypothetical protein